jgi:hypothetical protein
MRIFLKTGGTFPLKGGGAISYQSGRYYDVDEALAKEWLAAERAALTDPAEAPATDPTAVTVETSPLAAKEEE